MIKANELRIGSVIQAQMATAGEWRYIRIGGVKINGDHTFISWQTPGCCPADDVLLNGSYKPIPLTPDILEKLCSNYKMFRYELRLNKIIIEVDELMVDISTSVPIDGICESSGIAKIPLIQYLHQLQNVYFALTGEELGVSYE